MKKDKLKAVSGKERDSKLLDAAQRSKRDEIVALLKKGADVNCLMEDTNYTPLQLAVQSESSEGISCLLLNGADPLIPSKKGRTIVHTAAKVGNPVTLKQVLQNFPTDKVFEKDMHGKTALHWAVFNGHLHCIKMLSELPNCAGVVNEKDQEGKTPLHLACFRALEPEIQKLLSIGADPNLCDNHGRSSLHDAATNGSPKVVEMLLKHGANPTLKDNTQKTPADLAPSSCKQLFRSNKIKKGLPSLPKKLPKMPEEIPDDFDGSLGLAPSSVPVPPPFDPSSSQPPEMEEDEAEDPPKEPKKEKKIQEEKVEEEKVEEEKVEEKEEEKEEVEKESEDLAAPAPIEALPAPIIGLPPPLSAQPPPPLSANPPILPPPIAQPPPPIVLPPPP
eukprot:CAMPEP_0201502490 /NCGR_PEP_ID=MMETSP0151_2-20130828/84161_1 /ASSEMBLY_ACC=CAM_ASM_000257 /TAXON_ID=200890 /ORGANISM="Paramoeba atlantica, Strain 621/1 / CCAP 1560/9" /LENGTH=389 /DNA_ID=CAMNT_0047896087 /DNA_START=108 /DNA_END=1277 /DNA_ORIENTATION=+